MVVYPHVHRTRGRARVCRYAPRLGGHFAKYQDKLSTKSRCTGKGVYVWLLYYDFHFSILYYYKFPKTRIALM